MWKVLGPKGTQRSSMEEGSRTFSVQFVTRLSPGRIISKDINYAVRLNPVGDRGCGRPGLMRYRFRNQTVLLHFLQRFLHSQVQPLATQRQRFLIYLIFSDNLREHYPTCPERGLREIPDGGRRGRRPHACDSESITIQIE